MGLELRSQRLYADDIDEAIEICYQRGWTDGLPIILPTEARVVSALEYLGEDPQKPLGLIPPKNGIATIEKVVINSVMGGCLPEHIPVVIAAVEAMLEKPFNLNGVQATNGCVSPLAIVSGPIVKRLGFNSGDGVFGGGSRANAAVGRAVRLIMWNMGGAFPGEMDKATLGHPGKYAYCIAENGDSNPWEPIHVETGLKPEDSAVTMFACEAPHHLVTGFGTPQQTLNVISDAMATIGNNNFLLGGQNLVVLCPRAANSLYHAGWSRNDIREYLYENGRVSVAQASKGALYRQDAPDMPNWPKWIDPNDPNGRIPVIRRKEDINIVVAGGWGGVGALCALCPGWGVMGGAAQTKRVVEPTAKHGSKR